MLKSDFYGLLFSLNLMWNSCHVRPSHLYTWCVRALCYRYDNVKSKINEGLQEQVVSLSVCLILCLSDPLPIWSSVYLILCLYTFTKDVCKLLFTWCKGLSENKSTVYRPWDGYFYNSVIAQIKPSVTRH